MELSDFAGSHDGARNAAVIYSLLATCKLNDIEPFEWLKNALVTIPDYKANQLHKLIPGQKQQKNYIRKDAAPDGYINSQFECIVFVCNVGFGNIEACFFCTLVTILDL